MSPLRQAWVLAMLLSSSVAGAHEGAPEGAGLARLDSALAAATRARLTTVRGVAVVSETRATAAGVEYGNLLVSQRVDTLRSPGVIAWEVIRGIETQRGARSRWLRPEDLGPAGGVVGAALGIVGYQVRGWGSAAGLSPFLFPALGAAVGVGAGMLVERRASRWRPLYP